MAINYPGPYTIDLIYSVNASPGGLVEHKQTLSVDIISSPTPGTAFSAITVLYRDGHNGPLDNALTAWLTPVRALFNSSNVTFIRWELWKNTPLSFERTYVSTENIGLTGSTGTGAIAYAELILTFRTFEGGVFKLHFEEHSTYSPQSPITYSAASTNIQDIVDFILDPAANIFLARDTSYPLSLLNILPGGNEATFKKRTGRT